MRPAGNLCKEAMKYKSKVTLYYSNQMPSNANEISNNIQQKAFKY